MKNLNILNIIYIALYCVLFLLTLDAAFGSYQESEPHAGNILFIASGGILCIGVFIFFKLKINLYKKN